MRESIFCEKEEDLEGYLEEYLEKNLEEKTPYGLDPSDTLKEM